MLITPKLQDDAQTFWLGLMRDCDFQSLELCLPDGLNILTLMDERDRKYMLKDNFANYQKNFDANLGVMAVSCFFLYRSITLSFRTLATHHYSVRAMRDMRSDGQCGYDASQKLCFTANASYPLLFFCMYCKLYVDTGGVG